MSVALDTFILRPLWASRSKISSLSLRPTTEDEAEAFVRLGAWSENKNTTRQHMVEVEQVMAA